MSEKSLSFSLCMGVGGLSEAILSHVIVSCDIKYGYIMEIIDLFHLNCITVTLVIQFRVVFFLSLIAW